eukprot:1338545-Pyramimonas_sp.AAC.1
MEARCSVSGSAGPLGTSCRANCRISMQRLKSPSLSPAILTFGPWRARLDVELQTPRTRMIHEGISRARADRREGLLLQLVLLSARVVMGLQLYFVGGASSQCLMPCAAQQAHPKDVLRGAAPT